MNKIFDFNIFQLQTEDKMVNHKLNRRPRLKSNVFLHKWWNWFWPTNTGQWLLFALILCLMVLFAGQPARAETPETPDTAQSNHRIEQQLDLAAGLERNRTLGERWMLWGIYQLESDTQYRLRTGLSYNTASGYINALFVEFGYENINNSKYSARLKLLGNQYGEYSKAANSIIPYIHWDNSLYFTDAGLNYRFIIVNDTQLWNIFDYQTEFFELVPYYQLGLRVSLKDNRSALAVALKNFDEMYAGNIGAYRLNFNYRYQINDQITAFGNLDFWQSGGIVMSNTYYKTGIYGGIEVKL